MNYNITSFEAVTENPDQKDFPKHTHDFYEIYCFLDGDAFYFVEGTRYPLQPGDLILIRKGELHLIQFLSVKRYERFCVHFELGDFRELDPEGRLLSPFLDHPLGSFNHYPAAMFPDNHWVSLLRRINSTSLTHEKLWYLLPLLAELADDFQILKNQEENSSQAPVSAMISYIQNHLSEDLSLTRLEQHFFTSKTHMNRLFKQATGTTVWEYITVKRLFLARELLDAGQNPSSIFTQCGFKDYSTFFRAYKQYFGVCPSTRQNAITNHYFTGADKK